MMQRFRVRLRYEAVVEVDAQCKRDALDFARNGELDKSKLILRDDSKISDVETIGYVNRETNEIMKRKERRLNLDV